MNDTLTQSIIAREGSQISQVVQILVQGLNGLPTDYSTRIQNFLHEYLGTSEQPVPFGGRKAELEALDKWLKEPSASPYALLIAEAGRGKSALLVRWVESLIARGEVHVVFVPVSIRFETNRASVAFTALAARLSEIYGEPVKWKDLSAQQWRGVCESYLKRTPPDGKPLLVILDGLDEAADFTIKASFFPLRPPSGVRAVISARYLAGDVDESGWRRRLGWKSEALAVNLPLPPLTPDGLRDVLRQMGHPLDQLATNVDVVGELYRLSEGDPLLVGLYVEALLPYGDHTAIMTPEELQAIQPGLSGYFERWWEEQEEQWGQQERDPLGEREEVLDFFNLCAAALGPLTRNEIAEIAGGRLSSGMRLKKITKEVERFIIGDGKKLGYTFSHSRLGYYFWEEMTQPEQRKWEERFLNFGHHTLERLNNGTCDPHEAPSYAIQYYGAHLERADALSNAFYALVSEGWMRAWEALERTHTGFLSDVERAWSRAEAESERDIVMQIKCALCRASVTARSANIPPKLLALAVQNEQLIAEDALEIIWQMPETWRGRALSELASHLPHPLQGKALQTARAMEDELQQVEVLNGLAAYLSDEWVGEAQALAQTIGDESWRFFALRSLAQSDLSALLESLQNSLRAGGTQGTSLLDSMKLIPTLFTELLTLNEPWKLLLQMLSSLLNELKALTIEIVFSILIKQQAQEVEEEGWTKLILRMLFSATEKLEALIKVIRNNESSRLFFSSWLKTNMSSKTSVARWQINIGHESREYEFTLRELRELAKNPKLLGAAITGRQDFGFDSLLLDLVSVVHEILPESLFLSEMMVDIQKMTDANTFDMLAFLMSVTLREEQLFNDLGALVAQASDDRLQAGIQFARSQGEKFETMMLSAFAPHLPKPERETILREALTSSQVIGDKSSQLLTVASSGLAAHLPHNLLEEVFRAALSMKDEFMQIEVLSELAAYLPSDLLEEMAREILSIKEESLLPLALSRVAESLPEPQKSEVLEAIASIQLRDKSNNAKTFKLFKYFPNEWLEKLFTMQSSIGNAGIFIFLAFYLPEPQKSMILRRILTSIPETLKNSPGSPEPLPPNFMFQIPNKWLGEFAQMAEQAIVNSGEKEVVPVVMSELATHLLPSDEWRRKGLAGTQAIGFESSYALLLSGLITDLSDEMVEDALGVALDMRNESARVKALSKLVSRLSEPQKSLALDKALSTARAIENSRDRVKALSSLIANLPAWAEAQPTASYIAWKDTLRGLSIYQRSYFLNDLQTLMPFTLALAGEKKEEMAIGIYRAIQEVCEWWP